MSVARRIAINAVSQSGLSVLTAALGLVVVPFLITKLGKDGYGLITLAVSMSGLCGIADLGISGALGRQLSEALARRDRAMYRRFVSTACVLNFVTGITCAAGLFVLAPALTVLFGLPSLLRTSGIVLLRTYGTVTVLLTFLTLAPKAVLASYNRFYRANYIDGVRRLLQALGLLLLLSSTGLGVIGWGIVCMTADAAAMVMMWRAARHTHPELRVSLECARVSTARDLFGLGSHFTLLHLSSQLSISADPFILSACLGPSSIALYRPAAQVFGSISQVISTLANQLHPLATKAHIEGNSKDLVAILFRGTKYTLLIGAVACGLVIPLAFPLCKAWLGGALGPQYRVCAAVLVIQAVTQCASFASGTQWTVLLGVRRTAVPSYGRFVLAIVNISASWAAVKYLQLGVVGVVLPTMLIELLWRPVMACYAARAVGAPVREYIKHSYVSPLATAAIVLLIGQAGVMLAAPERTVTVIGTSAVLAIAGAVAIWLVGFTVKDRKDILQLVQGR